MLNSIPGVTVLEFERNRLNSRCCGSGGAARKVFHENAIAMGRLTIDEAVAKKADRLILACPACYAKVNEAMQGHKNQIRITDIMELVSGLIYEIALGDTGNRCYAGSCSGSRVTRNNNHRCFDVFICGKKSVFKVNYESFFHKMHAPAARRWRTPTAPSASTARTRCS